MNLSRIHADNDVGHGNRDGNGIVGGGEDGDGSLGAAVLHRPSLETECATRTTAATLRPSLDTEYGTHTTSEYLSEPDASHTALPTRCPSTKSVTRSIRPDEQSISSEYAEETAAPIGHDRTEDDDDGCDCSLGSDLSLDESDFGTSKERIGMKTTGEDDFCVVLSTARRKVRLPDSCGRRERKAAGNDGCA